MRQAQTSAMQALGSHICVGASNADEDTFAHLVEQAEPLAWPLQAVPVLFPQGTSLDDLDRATTHASPKIWQ